VDFNKIKSGIKSIKNRTLLVTSLDKTRTKTDQNTHMVSSNDVSNLLSPNLSISKDNQVNDIEKINIMDSKLNRTFKSRLANIKIDHESSRVKSNPRGKKKEN